MQEGHHQTLQPRVRPRQISVGDLILRKTKVSDPTRAWGKLAPTWEGPYRVVKVVREGTCILASLEGKQLPLAHI
ncbi:hypothetical protein BHM03_00031101 [Ensete ventricosum]|uniref:Uncharacterized protein n=1 Tax=Ensete ventricosum TaxID=4639 RepID=A0A445MII3_ENSVE|nr:hypothetical protein BHM03_00031101 [Ensete ventricosum]